VKEYNIKAGYGKEWIEELEHFCGCIVEWFGAKYLISDQSK
jgi:hypothetical protein